MLANQLEAFCVEDLDEALEEEARRWNSDDEGEGASWLTGVQREEVESWPEQAVPPAPEAPPAPAAPEAPSPAEPDPSLQFQ